MKKLNNLEPQKVFGFFEDICSIPHGSGNEKALSDYIVSFAKDRKLEVTQDELNNVLVVKPASKGMEGAEAVILQAHLDMVAVAEDGKNIDFEKDPIDIIVDGDSIKARGTSLGADDGIGIAMILAVLDSDTIKHPRLEAVFTVQEEIGLEGAKGFDVSKLTGRKMINIDSEDEDELVVGCAGGARVDIGFRRAAKHKKGYLYKITISGLIGGHSGCEIHKGQANANILMGRLLFDLLKDIDYRLVSITGGDKDNAIATSCTAVIMTSQKQKVELKSLADYYQTSYKGLYAVTDPKLSVKVTSLGKQDSNVLKRYELYRLLYIINITPNGVVKMSQTVDGLVETSLNLGVVRVDEANVNITYAVRSNVDSERDMLLDKLCFIAESMDADFNYHGEYPAWECNGISDFDKKIAREYEKLSGRSMKILTIHAGLECAYFAKKIKGIDAVSIGPNLKNVHTVREELSIESTMRVWKLLVNVLEDTADSSKKNKNKKANKA